MRRRACGDLSWRRGVRDSDCPQPSAEQNAWCCGSPGYPPWAVAAEEARVTRREAAGSADNLRGTVTAQNLRALGTSCFVLQIRSGFAQRRLGDIEPLFLKRTLGWKLASSPVPVTRVGSISLFAVQVGMNPGARRILVLLCRFMGPLPIAFGIPPQTGEGKAQMAGRLFAQHGMAEFLESHKEWVSGSRS